ncbi:MAG: DNA-formamidopyrimidine glycosylase family protein [Mycobacteriales bacterium]
MPELPEVEALARFLAERAVDHAVARVDVAAVNVLKTYDPPPQSLQGLTLTGTGRHGKFLDLDVDGLHLVIHLARAGWLQWREKLSPAPPKPGRSPLALRLHLDDGSGFDVTEQGTQKRLAVYVVRDPAEVPGIGKLGPDALSLDASGLAELAAAHRTRLKGFLTDQSVIAGIGNAYSDEIMHTARLSPFALVANLKPDEIERLAEAIHGVLTDAVERSVGQQAATLKAEKRSGLRVHARAGLPCPVCGDTVAEVSFADRAFQYCPTCQTGGKLLADRRLSRLLK